jgi:hypothetical protein
VPDISPLWPFQIVQLLDKWAKLHAVRTVVSIAAFAGFTYAAVCAKK